MAMELGVGSEGFGGIDEQWSLKHNTQLPTPHTQLPTPNSPLLTPL
jgi:hypothetical protein